MSMAKRTYESQIEKTVENFSAQKSIPEAAPAANYATDAPAPPQEPGTTVNTALKAKKPVGRPKKNGEMVKIALNIPVALYEKLSEEANDHVGGNISRTIILTLGEKYGVKIY